MIDTNEYIDCATAGQNLPGRPSANAVWRWAARGVLGRDRQRVRLRHIRVGKKLFTTMAWLMEFSVEYAAARVIEDAPPAERVERVGPARRKREIAEAMAELARA